MTVTDYRDLQTYERFPPCLNPLGALIEEPSSGEPALLIKRDGGCTTLHAGATIA